MSRNAGFDGVQIKKIGFLMNFAFCLYKYFPYGGLQKDFYCLASTCVSRGHTVDVYTGSWTGDLPEDFTVHIVSPRGLTNHRQYLLFAGRVMDLVSYGSYDAVVGFNKMPGLDVYFAADACYAHRMAKKSFLYKMLPRYKVLMNLEKSVFEPEADTRILTISEIQKNQYIDHYQTPENRFYAVPPWLSGNFVQQIDKPGLREQFRNKFFFKDDDFVVLMVGSGFKTKGVDRAIRAVSALPQGLKAKTRLVVAGKGSPGFYLRLAKKLGCTSSIYFAGQTDDVPAFLAGADLLLHPSYHEAAGTVLIEAMAAGLPVLVTDVCGFGVHVQKAEAGKLVPSPFRQETLNRMLASMISCKELARLGNNGKEYVRKTDVYNRHERAADVIEKTAIDKPKSHLNSRSK